MSTAARLDSSGSWVSGWSTLEYVATADTARVSSRAYGAADWARCCALMIRDAAMSSIARVIFFIDSVDLIRARYSRTERAMASAPLLLDDLLLLDVLVLEGDVLFLAGLDALTVGSLELVEEGVVGRRELVLGGVLELQALADAGEDALMAATQVVEELVLEAQDVVEPTRGARPQRDRHLLDRVRRVLRLLEQGHQALTAVELLARGGVEVGGEHREGLHGAELRQVDLERAGDGLHRLRHRRAAHSRDRDTHVDGGALVGREQVGLQEDLAVGDRDDVGRDERRDVVGLGLDDRQTRHRALAHVVGELRAALEEPAVQVEHVAGVGLTARRTTQQQRHGAVGLGLLGQVVEHDEDVLALVHPVLADGRAGVRREVLEARRVGRGRGHDGGVLERAGLLEGATHGGDGRALLADRDVDAAHLLVRVAGLPVLLLVDDRVDGDRGLAGRAVTDDQLALAAADGRQGVDR